VSGQSRKERPFLPLIGHRCDRNGNFTLTRRVFGEELDCSASEDVARMRFALFINAVDFDCG
jgi:hypothetical protein